MKTQFSANVKALRKKQHITQEQLAEAMGVTAGAVYKWERGVSTPDIGLVMDLANFFGVSVDALVGYTMRASDKAQIIQKLKQIKLDKSYADCWEEVDGWLQRYPNDFDIIYNGGLLYNLAGIETQNHRCLMQSVKLLNHACTLIEQNNDSKISETAIHQNIAISYLSMGKTEEGLKQLKAYNPCGINDDLIGQELAATCRKPKEAAPYLARALIQNTVRLYRIVICYLDIFLSKDNYNDAIEMLQWMLAYLKGLRPQKGISYLDRSIAILLTVLGILYLESDEPEQTKACFREARWTALGFDAAPDYTTRNVRYCEDLETQTAYDDSGDSAMEAILHTLQDGADGPNAIRFQLWEEVCHEE